MLFCWKRLKQNIFSSKTSVKRTVQFLIENSYFTVGNVLLLYTVDITFRTHPAPFWTNLYFYNCEFKYITHLIRTNKLKDGELHGTFQVIDDLCALNDGGEFDKAFLEIYPTDLELKVEHNGSHSIFLDLRLL